MNSPLVLKNIELLVTAVHHVKSVSRHLPKMITFSGPSGYGKSFAAAYVTNKFNCVYVELGNLWGVSFGMDKILEALGTSTTKKVAAAKAEAVADALRESGRILILDEADHWVKNESKLEVIRWIHNSARVPIILIGEEHLPKKLELIESFHNRMIDWVKAEAVTLVDAKKLAIHYAPKLQIEEDLLVKLVNSSGGRVRRLCVNIDKVKNEAVLYGWKSVNLETWGDRALFTGAAPSSRKIGR